MHTIDNIPVGYICPLASLCDSSGCEHKERHIHPIADCHEEPCDWDFADGCGIICGKEEPLQTWIRPDCDDDDDEDEDWD